MCLHAVHNETHLCECAASLECWIAVLISVVIKVIYIYIYINIYIYNFLAKMFFGDLYIYIYINQKVIYIYIYINQQQFAPKARNFLRFDDFLRFFDDFSNFGVIYIII